MNGRKVAIKRFREPVGGVNRCVIVSETRPGTLLLISASDVEVG